MDSDNLSFQQFMVVLVLVLVVVVENTNVLKWALTEIRDREHPFMSNNCPIWKNKKIKPLEIFNKTPGSSRKL